MIYQHWPKPFMTPQQTFVDDGPISFVVQTVEGCFEMECVNKIRAPARCKVQRAPVPEKITPCPGKFGCARGSRAKFHGFGCWPVQFLIEKIISLKF